MSPLIKFTLFFYFFLFRAFALHGEQYVELPVDKVIFHADDSVQLISTSFITCKNTTLAPGQITQEDVDHSEFKMSLFGTDCLTTELEQERIFSFKNIKTFIFDFLKEKSGLWTVHFINSSESMQISL